MKVSILIPCYNSAQFIAETLDSVLAQTHTNWECIVVDDHSTDNSVEIVDTYCQKYPEKFKHYTNPRKGACAARNTAFVNSSGDYVKYLDADDIIFDEHAIEYQLKHAQQCDCDIVYGVEYYYDNTFEEKNLKDIRIPEMYSDTFAMKYFQLHPITSNYLINKSKVYAIKWNEKLKSGQEFYYFIYCYLEGLTFGYTNINSVKIRRHHSSNRISNVKPKVYAWQSLTLFEELDKLILQYDKKNDIIFLTNYELHKLGKSYEAVIQKNLKCFLRINALVKKKYRICASKKTKWLWRLNRFSPIVGFVWYYYHLKYKHLNLLTIDYYLKIN